MPYKLENNFDNIGTNLIETISFLAPTGFKMTLDNLKFKNAQFLIQMAALPDLSIDAAPYNTPQRNIGMHADKATYSPFECTFLIDEKLINYQEIHDWLLAQVTEADTVKKTRDITLSIMTSSNNVSRQIQFVDAYPITLSSVAFDSTQTDVEYLVANATFNYSYYKLI